jgi:very-short-patch-repair endonuclease
MAPLPLVCGECHKLKMPHLGVERQGRRYNVRHFTCHACLEKPQVVRRHRQNNESVPERQVREWLTQHKIPATAEYSLGGFLYDFAVPSLNLLIEIDSKKYHSGWRRKTKDLVKTAVAKNEGWHLCRIMAGDFLIIDLKDIVIKRLDAVGLNSQIGVQFVLG